MSDKARPKQSLRDAKEASRKAWADYTAPDEGLSIGERQARKSLKQRHAEHNALLKRDRVRLGDKYYRRQNSQ